jgi:tetratricopeptide (TPR) repeat protein
MKLYNLNHIRNSIIVWTVMLPAIFCGCMAPGFTKQPLPNSQQLPDTVQGFSEKERGAGHYYDFLRAQLAARQGRLDQAVEFMKSAIEKAPEQPVLKKELALIYMKQGNEKEALDMAKKTLSQDPDEIDALIVAASLWQAAGKNDSAVRAYEKVIAKAPERENIYLILARLYLRAGQFQKAADLLEGFVKNFPGNYTGFYYLGKSYSGLKQPEKAIGAFQKCLAIEPGLMEPRAALIDIYSRQGKDQEVVAQYEAVLENDPQNVAAALELGIIYENKGLSEKARPLWLNLVARTGPDSEVIKAVTRFFLARKRYQDAKTSLSAMLKVDPQNPDLNYLAGATFYLTDDNKKALEYFQKVTADSDFYPDAMIHQAIIFNKEKNTLRAVKLLETAMAKADSEGKVSLIPYLSAFYQEQQHYQQAADLLAQGLAIDPENIELHYELGVLYDKMGNSQGAVEKMKEVIEKAPEHADALNYLGYTYADKNMNLDEAEALISRALELDPENGYILDSMGWVFYRKGEYEKARHYLEKAVSRVPDDPIILEHLGDVYHKIDLPAQAVKYYRQALENSPEDEAGLIEKIEAIDQEGLQL